jgi:hypothetical protein
LVSIGLVPYLDTLIKRKQLADRIEQLIIGNVSVFPITEDAELEKLAQKFYTKILEKKTFSEPQISIEKATEISEKALYSVDLNSIVTEDVREIGAEWLCYQAIKQLEISEFLETQGWEKKQIDTALIHLISKAVYPASENKTEYWIQNNSGVASLFGVETQKITRHHLYDISKKLYQIKDKLEPFLSHKTTDLFDIQDKIVLYDLTNTYFEGRKEGSVFAKYGRSKEKRSDAKLISLALVTNAEGFVKYSKIYSGNISEPSTLLKTVEELSLATSESSRKPMVVMDAAFSTDENLTMLKEKGFDYLCVTRSKLKDYTIKNPDQAQIMIEDNRKNKIFVKKIEKKPAKKVVDGCNDGDTFLYIRSEQKAVKEASMVAKFSEKFEAELNNIIVGLTKPKGTKKLEKISERIGRIKQRYAYANKFYDIKIEYENEIVSNLIYTKKEIKPEKTNGVYFIRTSKKDLSETDLWLIYNSLTEIEATFRTLKTDLSIRPVHHQTDQNTEAHIYLGILAYQVVATIRYQLKAKKIKDSWQTIILKMNTQKSVMTSMLDDKNRKIVIKTCSQPTADVRAIYAALNYKKQPFSRKHIVLP